MTCNMQTIRRHFTHKICRCKANISEPIKRFNCSKKVNKPEWKSVVGLEIHAQITSASKLFSGASTEFGCPVNSSVSFFDAALPGTLPSINKRCVEAGIITALALKCKINPVSMFDRKHYFYADLPAGYQITQQRAALANNGTLQFQVFTPGIHKAPYTKMSKLLQLQLEQDSGKSLHDDQEARSLVDLNRAGVPLMELVFEPDLSDGEEAAALVKELILILGRIGTCSGKMEEGALRVDANISVQRSDSLKMGPRTEVKNISSVRGVANAISFEISRQMSLVKKGERVISETRAYDALSKQTVSMRDKEEKQDYRFMPEPNLPPLRVQISAEDPIQPHLINVPQLEQSLPELPEATRQRLMSEHKLSLEAAISFVNDELLLQIFTSIVSSPGRNSRLVGNFILQDLVTVLNKNKIQLENSDISVHQLGELIDLLQTKTINLLTARRLLQEMVLDECATLSPSQLVKQRGLQQILDPAKIEEICLKAIDENPKIVEQYYAGKKKLFGALIGIISKTTNQQADMAAVTECLKRLLEKNKQ